jgi:voltage-gated sodium channel
MLIIINSIYIGIETDNNLDEAGSSGWVAGEMIFTALFSIELALRLYGLRIYFFRDSWNLFDLILVVIGVVDTFLLSVISAARASDGKKDESLSVFMAMRVARLLRLARIFRLLRFFKELWLLVAGVLSALRTLMWTWLFVLLIIYVFGLVATRLLGQEYGDKDPDMREYFGTVSASMFTLFQVVTTEGWADVARGSMVHQPSMWVFFILFISITTFAIMNVVTAVIVENTLDQAMKQKGDISKKLDKERQKALTKLYDVFQIADLDGDGELTKDEFLQALQNRDVMINLHAVEIDLRSAEGLFDIMDYDDSGHLDVTEFIEGCMRARGDAKAKDVLAVQCDLWRTQEWIRQELEQTNDFVMERFERLKKDVHRVKQKVLSPEFQARCIARRRSLEGA